MKKVTIKEMPMIPLRGATIFPTTVLYFDVGREKSVRALEEAMINDQIIFLSGQKNPETDLPVVKDFYDIGIIAKIKQMLKLPTEGIRVLVEGISRGQIEKIVFEDPYFKCEISEIEEKEARIVKKETEARVRKVISKFEKYIKLNSRMPHELFEAITFTDQPGRLADIIASQIEIKPEQRQEVLETLDVDARLDLITKILTREISILNIEKDIDKRVKNQIGKSQRECYLKEQLRVIQEELGQDENIDEEADKFLKKLKKLKLPAKITKKIEKEINRMQKTQGFYAEVAVIRSYIEWILDLPWNKSSKGEIDINTAEKILNEDHYGMDKVKERILEHIAVLKLTNNIKGSILCLVGPPGVGKTSIAKSIARSINRNFTRMSLGGVRDEAEIRGHRRTYVGAIPGRVMSAIKEIETNNPVFLFDEIDKIGNDYRGDPASALLEVLDPEQNKEFTDHFLEVPFDLSKVIFITTANTTETIPRPLLDRMEVIYLSGYTEEEKLNIAKKYLIPKKALDSGLSTKKVTFTEKAIRDIINYYTRESGVRNLEREIANICRKIVREMLSKKQKGTESIKVIPDMVENYLGKRKFRYDIVEGENEIGVTTGLAWTSVGGDTLSIETTVMQGSGKLALTGQLGDVMQESAKAGLSYIRTNMEALGIDYATFRKSDLHVHIPEGATPKDGPSAGITMCTSMVSALKKIPVKKDIAMTGEITLRGKVLPVGGIKEKLLAANRAGIKTVLLPMENKRDLDEIPVTVKKKMKFIFVKDISEVLELAFEYKKA